MKNVILPISLAAMIRHIKNAQEILHKNNMLSADIQGCYVSVMDFSTNDVVAHFLVGALSRSSELQTCQHFSHEKNMRLCKNFYNNKHVTASDSRSPNRVQYAGARVGIWGGRPFGIGISGYGEWCDEAIAEFVIICGGGELPLSNKDTVIPDADYRFRTLLVGNLLDDKRTVGDLFVDDHQKELASKENKDFFVAVREKLILHFRRDPKYKDMDTATVLSHVPLPALLETSSWHIKNLFQHNYPLIAFFENLLVRAGVPREGKLVFQGYSED